jgi:hypothetical protein
MKMTLSIPVIVLDLSPQGIASALLCALKTVVSAR